MQYVSRKQKKRKIKRHRTFVHAFLLTRCIRSKRKLNFIPITPFLNKVDIPLMCYTLNNIITNFIKFILILSRNALIKNQVVAEFIIWFLIE